MALRLVSTREDVRPVAHSTARAMVSGTMCYIAGASGYDWRCGLMPASLEQQTRNALAAAQDALENSGFCLADVVRINYALTREGDLGRALRVGDAWFGDNPPDMTYEIVWPRQSGQRVSVEMMAQKAG